MSSDQFIQEVEEEVRRDRLSKLWARYGTWLTAGAVALVVGVGGYTGWRQYDAAERGRSSMAFTAALGQIAGDRKAAIAAFEKLAADGKAPYGAYAALKVGQLKADDGDAAGAAAAFLRAQALADATETREFAQLIRAMRADPSGKSPEVGAAVQALAAKDKPFSATAREMLAVRALEAGDAARARELLTALKDDAAAPASLRSRAADLLAVMGPG